MKQTNGTNDNSTDERSSDLRQSPMMAHLLDALEAGTDIGHYGRLTFVMVARHFLAEEELVQLLTRQPEMDEKAARMLVLQVQERDYNPPQRQKILEWQSQQEFPICPDTDDPNSCNVYRELQFPQRVYDHVEEYYEERAEAQMQTAD
jgi:DNA primase large subunit